MTSKTLTSIGLILGIVGVIMLFLWGWPQPVFELDNAVTLGSASNEAEIAAAKARHSALAISGLILVLIGQGLQFSAVILSPSPQEQPGSKAPTKD